MDRMIDDPELARTCRENAKTITMIYIRRHRSPERELPWRFAPQEGQGRLSSAPQPGKTKIYRIITIDTV